MSVKIGHASIDENGNATGGRGGDQSGKEVVTRLWYDKGWNVLLRPVRPEVAEKSAQACEAACGNGNIGYDQGGRNTLYTAAKTAGFDLGGIETPCECDCSSLMHVCAMAGGANLTYGSNGFTTRTMVSAFVKSGDYEKITGSAYLTSDRLLRRGDILVKEGSHTVMVLENGADTAPQPEATKPQEMKPAGSLPLPVLGIGAQSDAVKALQLLLTAHGFRPSLFGKFDDRTVEALVQFQKAFNLNADGICGIDTWGALLGLTGVG